MASSRAADVAEVLWELKRAGKVAKFSSIAQRAGFSAGSNGRAMVTALRTVRRDWPHLQWWRAIKDDGVVEVNSEHAQMLRESGYEIEESSGGDATVKQLENHLMEWKPETDGAAGATAQPDAESSRLE